jgi:hypothetical protein
MRALKPRFAEHPTLQAESSAFAAGAYCCAAQHDHSWSGEFWRDGDVDWSMAQSEGRLDRGAGAWRRGDPPGVGEAEAGVSGGAAGQCGGEHACGGVVIVVDLSGLLFPGRGGGCARRTGLAVLSI